jgi:hypothetical protein
MMFCAKTLSWGSMLHSIGSRSLDEVKNSIGFLHDLERLSGFSEMFERFCEKPGACDTWGERKKNLRAQLCVKKYMRPKSKGGPPETALRA